MRTIGVIATGIAAVIVLAGSVLGIRAIPDVKRYLRIRSM
jgi:hypothetical protein